MILAIESGTTRTRIWLLSAGREPVEAASGVVGARDMARGQDRAWLLAEIRKLVEAAAAKTGVAWTDIEAIVGFGMISSELGLVEVPPLPAPIAWRQLAAAMEKLDEPLHARVLLVPGVSTEADHLQTADVMRGEETEIAGLLALERIGCPFLYISPGSHSKFVWVDSGARIAWSLTTLSGELIWALHRETILAGLIDPGSAALDAARVEEGAHIARTYGLTRTLFTGRLANRMFDLSPDECSSLLHGAVAETDLCALQDGLPHVIHPVSVAVSGRGPLKECYRLLLESRPWVREVQSIDQPLGALGALTLYDIANRRSERVRSISA